jgi:hypothetical protein
MYIVLCSGKQPMLFLLASLFICTLVNADSMFLSARLVAVIFSSKTLKGQFFVFISFYERYSTQLHLPPLRFHCVGGCWDGTKKLKVYMETIYFMQL